MINLNNLLKIAINASINGGAAIMEIYDTFFEVEFKEDQSPLTIADKNCNLIIEKHLRRTGIPILSEEGSKTPFSIRKKWEYYWLVDPLDGTKEFIKRNGEFTVNIALICNGDPILGVIYVPVKNQLYFANEELGSFKSDIKSVISDLDNLILQSNKLPINYNRNNFIVVGSRSHMSKETKDFINTKKRENKNVELYSIGSSLKICMVAEGKADVYPRYAPTMEWDTAAGHAIAKMAGFRIRKYGTDQEIKYNKRNLLNPWFLVE